MSPATETAGLKIRKLPHNRQDGSGPLPARLRGGTHHAQQQNAAFRDNRQRPCGLSGAARPVRAGGRRSAGLLRGPLRQTERLCAHRRGAVRLSRSRPADPALSGTARQGCCRVPQGGTRRDGSFPARAVRPPHRRCGRRRFLRQDGLHQQPSDKRLLPPCRRRAARHGASLPCHCRFRRGKGRCPGRFPLGRHLRDAGRDLPESVVQRAAEP